LDPLTAKAETKHIQTLSLRTLSSYFLRLGTFGFGDPIALTAVMQRDLVDRNGWFSQEDFKKGMVLSQLSPGPLAAQLAIYYGWSYAGWIGGAFAGISFVLPSFVMVIALAALYIRFGDLGLIQSLFAGIGPAVIAIIALGTWKLSKKKLAQSGNLLAIAMANMVVTAATGSEQGLLILASGFLLAAWVYFSKSRSALPLIVGLPEILSIGLYEPATSNTLWKILLFFTKAGSFVFGSGLAIVPFLHGGVINEFQWLNERQVLDAVAVAMITPGPVVITVGFIGYLVAGFYGALLAGVGTFLPCYLFTVIPAPHYERFANNIYVKEFSNGVTAAVVGAIAGAVIVMGKQTLTNYTSIVICMISIILLLKIKRITEPMLILLSAIVGIGMAFLK
jgi:chromate transporter